MAERMPAKRGQRASAAAGGGAFKQFSDEERAALRERAQELGRTPRRGSRTAEVGGESQALAKIAEMGDADRALAERLHALITSAVPGLSPTTWYGMPAYAKDGAVICFFQPARKFRTRYATLGFSDKAHLDEGGLWPVYFAIKEVTAAEEERIAALVKRAVN